MSNHLLPHFFDANHFVVQRFIDALAGLTDRRKVDETLETRSLAGNITAIHGRVIGVARAAHIDSGSHTGSEKLVGIHAKPTSVLEEVHMVVDKAGKQICTRGIQFTAGFLRGGSGGLNQSDTAHADTNISQCFCARIQIKKFCVANQQIHLHGKSSNRISRTEAKSQG